MKNLSAEAGVLFHMTRFFDQLGEFIHFEKGATFVSYEMYVKQLGCKFIRYILSKIFDMKSTNFCCLKKRPTKLFDPIPKDPWTSSLKTSEMITKSRTSHHNVSIIESLMNRLYVYRKPNARLLKRGNS